VTSECSSERTSATVTQQEKKLMCLTGATKCIILFVFALPTAQTRSE